LLEAVAETLMEKEVMTEEELDSIIKQYKGENGSSSEPQQ